MRIEPPVIVIGALSCLVVLLTIPQILPQRMDDRDLLPYFGNTMLFRLPEMLATEWKDKALELEDDAVEAWEGFYVLRIDRLSALCDVVAAEVGEDSRVVTVEVSTSAIGSDGVDLMEPAVLKITGRSGAFCIVQLDYPPDSKYPKCVFYVERPEEGDVPRQVVWQGADSAE